MGVDKEEGGEQTKLKSDPHRTHKSGNNFHFKNL
jgi:hypothetical protein